MAGTVGDDAIAQLVVQHHSPVDRATRVVDTRGPAAGGSAAVMYRASFRVRESCFRAFLPSFINEWSAISFQPFVARHSSLVTRHCPIESVARHWSLVTRHSNPVTAYCTVAVQDAGGLGFDGHAAGVVTVAAELGPDSFVPATVWTT